MAQYRFSAQVIGRSSGRSSVAAAAYRAGVSLADERTGVIHDFSRRHGILHTEIMAPDNAPAWMHDRAQLWNAVEKVETRINSQLAREVQLSLPHELDDAQRLELVRGFVRDQFVSRGMIADLAIHAPGRDGDDRNHHAHIMLTMRELTGEGFHKSKATAAAREWNAKENIEQWREAWGDYQNRTFRGLGLEIAVDHRSLSAQGVDREATFHLGTAANDMERRGKASRIGDQNRAIDDRNNLRDRADQAATVISLEIERLKRAEGKAIHERLTALENAQALSALDLERKHHRQTLNLQASLAATYGDQKRDLTASAAAIDSRLAATGFRKVVRDLAGRSERDRQHLHNIRRTLSDIGAREQDATAILNRQHTAERDAQRAAQVNQQGTTRARVAAEFERKRRDELRARRNAQAVERSKQQRQAEADQRRTRYSRSPESRARRQVAPSPPLENPAVKPQFDKAADAEAQRIAKGEQEKRFVRVASPQPTPQGEVIQPRREEREVPKPTPAKIDAAKRESPSSIRAAAPDGYTKPTPAPVPVKDWNTPATSPVAPTPQKDWDAATRTTETPFPRKDWDTAAREPEKPIVRSRDKDRDFDRDR